MPPPGDFRPSFYLCYPPFAEPYAPYLSVPELTAALKERGFSCQGFDFNILAHENMLTGENLKTAIDTRLDMPSEAFTHYQFRSNPHFDEKRERFYIRALGNFLAERIDDAKDKLRDSLTYAFDRYGQPISEKFYLVFDTARRLYFLSPLFHCSVSHSSQGYYLSSNDVRNAIEYAVESPYFPFFKKTLALQNQPPPDVFGVSVSFAEQLIPAIVLCSVAKTLWPNSIYLFGGNFVTLKFDRLLQIAELMNVIDGMVRGDGEGPLLQIGENMRRGRDWQFSVDSLAYVKKQIIISPTSSSEWNITNSPPPDFDDLSLDQYFLATKQLVYMTARGCYWGKCKFCNYAATHKNFRAKSIEQVIGDLEYLTSRYGIDSFYLADDAIHPKRLHQIAKSVNRRKLRLNWWCLSRFDLFDGKLWSASEVDEILRSGCYRIFFGGETISTKLQNRLNKGFGVDAILAGIDNVISTGLHIHVSMIIGLPGESLEQARKTTEWCLALSRHPRVSTRIHRFRLSSDSDFAKNPEIIAYETDGLNDIAPNIINYCELTKSSEEQISYRKSISRLKAMFLSTYRNLPLHCYPENHNYEGLQYHINNCGVLPDIPTRRPTKEEITDIFKMSNAVAFNLIPDQKEDSVDGYQIMPIDDNIDDTMVLILYNLRDDCYLLLPSRFIHLMERLEKGISRDQFGSMIVDDPDFSNLFEYLYLNGWVLAPRANCDVTI